MNLRRLLAAVAVACVVVGGFTPSSAQAASASTGRDNFYGTCDAQVHVSDTTTAGRVEVFGGWGCQVDKYFTGTLVCVLYLNGAEKARVATDLKTSSTEFCAVTYPDYSSTDTFYGKLIVKGAGSTNFTLTTGSIRT
ncbi:hypothetical protein [Micromonospora sp. AP08]|uniref:hypothetical protein n=1 Tax=Micromonospora sp. AP08 TaxID=2604467 RepID=UPI0011DD5099|nr:hypothetical protein [Micromonospora sp. AP08]